MSQLPHVSVVIPSHNRPLELRRAIDSVRGQVYGGSLDVIIVYDQAEPDWSLEEDEAPRVRVMRNGRTPGLAGARNTGILAADGDLIAFCDDDDAWVEGKLATQVERLAEFPAAPLVTTGIVVDFDGKSTVRRAGQELVHHNTLVRSRMSMLHSSTFIFRRASLLGSLGLINELIPGSQNEDWDILLRSSSLHPVVHVDEPLVRVQWGRASHFSRRWDTKIDSSVWMLENHDDVANDAKGAARLMGQIAFAHACSGDRDLAWRWAWRSIRRNPLEWRSHISSCVAVVPAAGEVVLSALHKWGRGV